MQGCTTDNPRVKYSDELKQRVTELLERRRDRAGDEPARPVKAIAIARALRFYPGSSHETRRRRVRELMDEMRRDGAPIASSDKGYWPAESVADFERTERFLRRMGLGHLATAGRIKRSPARARAAGQLELAPLAHRGASGRAAHDLYRPAPPTRPGDTEPETRIDSSGGEGWLF